MIHLDGYTIIASPKTNTVSQSAPLDGKYLQESTPETRYRKISGRSIDKNSKKPTPNTYQSLKLLKQKSSFESTSGNLKKKSLFKSVATK